MIQCIVLSKTNGLPGNGAGAFISPSKYAKLTRNQKENIVHDVLLDIYGYNDWDWVLNELGLEPARSLSVQDLIGAANTGGGGESEDHRLFKEYIATHPEALGLATTSTGRIEVLLPSADRIDVEFEQAGLRIAIEVKSNRSNRLDIIRGLFQCVKYKHLIEAQQATLDQKPNCRVILALQGIFPNDLSLTRSILGVEVLDGILTPPVQVSTLERKRL